MPKYYSLVVSLGETGIPVSYATVTTTADKLNMDTINDIRKYAQGKNEQEGKIVPMERIFLLNIIRLDE